MDSKDFQKSFEEAYKLLAQKTTNREKFESIRTLIKGVNPKLDEVLEKASRALSDVEKLQKGEVIDLTIENLPENSEEEKKRKKAILSFIKNWRDLKNEVERVKSELQDSREKSGSENAQSILKLLSSPKGAFGLITAAAIIIVSILVLTQNKSSESIEKVSNQQKSSKIQAIDVKGKKVPLSELRTGIGPECKTSGEEVLHYHTKNGFEVSAIDGQKVTDPGGCGFGKVNEVKIEEVEQPNL